MMNIGIGSSSRVSRSRRGLCEQEDDGRVAEDEYCEDCSDEGGIGTERHTDGVEASWLCRR